MFEKINRDFLQSYNCDTQLFDYIVYCKNKIKIRGENPEPLRIETSLKYYDNKVDNGRYVIHLSMLEFHKYDIEDQRNIFNLLGFDIDKFSEFLKLNITMFLGFDKGKGKIYFNLKNNILCFEPKKIKHYEGVGSHIFIVREQPNPKILAKHIRVKNKDKINWYGIGEDYLTIYYRPYVTLNESDLTEEEKIVYKATKEWYYHSYSNPKGRQSLYVLK